MPWTKTYYPESMKNLDDEVRNKAIDILNELMQTYDEDRAIPIAIARAKKWFENRGYDVSSDITHHLTPHERGWKLKRIDNDDTMLFKTKKEAMNKIKELSKESAMKVMIHDSKGKFQKVY